MLGGSALRGIASSVASSPQMSFAYLIADRHGEHTRVVHTRFARSQRTHARWQRDDSEMRIRPTRDARRMQTARHSGIQNPRGCALEYGDQREVHAGIRHHAHRVELPPPVLVFVLAVKIPATAERAHSWVGS